VANKTSIEWTDESVNPILARRRDDVQSASSVHYQGHYCEKISPGCALCYASRFQVRRHMPAFPSVKGNLEQVEVFFDESRLLDVLKRKKPTKYFWCDMTDMFGSWVPFEWIDKCFAVMALTPHHTHQVLTKRPERMAEYLQSQPDWNKALESLQDSCLECTAEPAIFDRACHVHRDMADEAFAALHRSWPLSNVWIGTSCEDQQRADERIPHLLRCPAAVRFLSCEPLLGPIDLSKFHIGWWRCFNCEQAHDPGPDEPLGTEIDCSNCGNPGPLEIDGLHLHWVICGGESGHGARPMHPDWARSLRDQCVVAGVSFFFKQWGEWAPVSTATGLHELPFGEYDVKTRFGFTKAGKKQAGRMLDGLEWNEFPSTGMSAGATTGGAR
jgi:protein gp37